MGQLPFSFRKQVRADPEPEPGGEPSGEPGPVPRRPSSGSRPSPSTHAPRPAPRTRAAPAGPLTVTQFCRALHATVEREHPQVAVIGEVSRWRPHDSGHAYFTLKDRNARIECVMWSSHVRRLRFVPEEGMTVVCRGRPSVFGRSGKLQLVTVHLEPQGLGALHAEFRQRVEALRAEGLLDDRRKRRIPLLPRRVGVVTSRDGAALHDVLRTLWGKDPGLHVVVSPTPVQGRGSAPRVAEALRRLDAHGGCDVILLARGGGSLEDLWAFNEEPVARAIVATSVPVISGVGHESDVTVADLVADVRAATPTAAAAEAADDRDAWLTAWQRSADRLHRAAAHQLARHRRRLEAAEGRLPPVGTALVLRSRHLDDLVDRLHRALGQLLRDRERQLVLLQQRLSAVSPGARLASGRRQLERCVERLETRVEAKRVQARHRLAHAVGRLEAHSPLSVLARGYAVVESEHGQVIRSPTDVGVGDRLRIRVHQGILGAVVNSTESATGTDEPHE